LSYYWLIPTPIVYTHTKVLAHFRIMKASQSSINKIENLIRKLYNCNASVYFNRKCIRQTLTPAYAKIKIPNTSPACRHTTESNQPTTKRRNKIPTLQKTEAENNIIPLTPNTNQHLEQLMAPHASYDWRQTLNRNPRKIQNTGQKLNHVSLQLTRILQPHHKIRTSIFPEI